MSIRERVKALQEEMSHLKGGDQVVEHYLDGLLVSLRRQRMEFAHTHGGKEPTKARTVALDPPHGTVTAMGELVEVGYLANKGEGRTFMYVHEFEQPLPVLVYDAKKRLFIAGGGYTVTARGIER